MGWSEKLNKKSKTEFERGEEIKEKIAMHILVRVGQCSLFLLTLIF